MIFLIGQGQLTPKVHGRIQPNFKLIQDYIVVLVTCKSEEDPIKNEGARVLTFNKLKVQLFSNQGQLTLKSVVEFHRNQISSKLFPCYV